MGYKIAIDGPAGAGKGYVAKKISEILNIMYVDTGAMYRAFGYYVTQNNIDLKDREQLKQALNNCNISFEKVNSKYNVILNGENIESKIRTPLASKMVLQVSPIEQVRISMVEKQREMAKEQSVIMEGRDIASVVFPDADVKIFLTASINERAKRRYLDFKINNPNVKLEEVIEEIKRRDEIDTTREVSPLVKVKDAIEVDTTKMTREEVVEHILSIIRDKGIEKIQ